MGWVDGKPKMVSERYVGTAAEVAALLDAREEKMLPERTRHLDFGAVAAAWGLLADLGAAAIIDGEAGAAPPGFGTAPSSATDINAPRGWQSTAHIRACPACRRRRQWSSSRGQHRAPQLRFSSL